MKKGIDICFKCGSDLLHDTTDDDGKFIRVCNDCGTIQEEHKKQKRKTHTSTQVKRRYNDKVYARIYADLPKELVAKFRAATQEQGVSVASVMKTAMESFVAEFPPAEKE